MNYRNIDTESMTMPSDEIVERVIRECFESEEMKEYLTALHEELSVMALRDIITGAMIPLSQKADLMKHVDSASYLDIKEALDALEIRPGQFFELSFEMNEVIDYRVEHCSYHLGPCTSIEKAKKHIRSYYDDIPEEDSLWEHRLDENWWFSMRLYDMNGDGEPFMLYTYYLIADEICYFDKGLYESETGFLFRTDGHYSRNCIDLNISIPFKAGDVVVADGRPFCEPKPVLLLEVSDDCCGVWALYKKTDGSVDTGAVKHGTVYDAGRDVMLSPLYRMRKYEGEPDCDGVKMVLEELGRVIANTKDAETEEEEKLTVLGMPVELFVERNAEKTLAEALGTEHYWYAEHSIECIELSDQSYYRYRRFVDPPLSYPNEQHITMDELLGLTVKELWDARAVKQNNFIEIVEKSAAWLKDYWVIPDLIQE